MGERLDVSKTETEGEAKIVKEPVTETKTVEVPVTHEELVVEKHDVTGDSRQQQTSSGGPVTSEEEIKSTTKRGACQSNKGTVRKRRGIGKEKTGNRD